MINAGRLDEKITFQTQAAGNGSRGERNGAWSNYKTVYAEVIEGPGNELDRARQKHEQASILFRIREPKSWLPDSKMRIVWDDITFDVGAAYRDPEVREIMIVTGSAIL